jgi:cytochrome c oxidase subunit 2
MVRSFLSLLLLCLVGAAVAAEPSIDDLVTTFNPDLWGGTIERTSTFAGGASNISTAVMHNFWFTFLVFLPFLILPQILLVYVIFKFRDRGDGRKPATFMHNIPLEITWTAIPVVALVIVAIPVWPLLFKMELPPEDVENSLVVTIRGRQFAWDYEYKREQVSVGWDTVANQQEPIVLVKDRPVHLAITSNDVNHAFWVPAFGVKKDAIIGRFNNEWFIPEKAGPFKGQCAELCGANHGQMIISAVVVEQPLFDLWVVLQRHRELAGKVWQAALEWKPGADDEALRKAVAGYRAKFPGDAKADLSLQFWMAHSAVSYSRAAPTRPADAAKLGDFQTQFNAWKANADGALMKSRRTKVDELLSSATAATADTPQPALAAAGSDKE